MLTLESPTIPSNLLDLHHELSVFVTESTKEFDESHDYFHMLQVVTNSFQIFWNDLTIQSALGSSPSNSEGRFIESDLSSESLELARLILIVAWLHDVRDHKYPNSISEEALYSFVVNEVCRKQYSHDSNCNSNSNSNSSQAEEEANYIIEIINNISFSKEAKGLRKSFLSINRLYQYALDIVTDADRLEAIGIQGIRRCEIYTKEHGGKVPEDVVIHCHEKLLRILPEGYIKTEYGKVLAQPLHQEIVDYVAAQQ
jgi:hypothetical protein